MERMIAAAALLPTRLTKMGHGAPRTKEPDTSSRSLLTGLLFCSRPVHTHTHTHKMHTHTSGATRARTFGVSRLCRRGHAQALCEALRGKAPQHLRAGLALKIRALIVDQDDLGGERPTRQMHELPHSAASPIHQETRLTQQAIEHNKGHDHTNMCTCACAHGSDLAKVRPEWLEQDIIRFAAPGDRKLHRFAESAPDL